VNDFSLSCSSHRREVRTALAVKAGALLCFFREGRTANPCKEG